jgi:hypothetical protein
MGRAISHGSWAILAVLVVLAAAPSVRAHHIAGVVLYDRDHDGVIDQPGRHRHPERLQGRRRLPPRELRAHDHHQHDDDNDAARRVPVPRRPLLVGRDARINNDADVRGTVGANALGGRVPLGKNVFMVDGTRLIGDTVQIGNTP